MYLILNWLPKIRQVTNEQRKKLHLSCCNYGPIFKIMTYVKFQNDQYCWVIDQISFIKYIPSHFSNDFKELFVIISGFDTNCVSPVSYSCFNRL